jgi:hypothetical protein
MTADLVLHFRRRGSSWDTVQGALKNEKNKSKDKSVVNLYREIKD